MIHSFLLIGQSNAAGRGFLEEAQPLETLDGRIKVLRNGRWQAAFRPINFDRSFSGTCLAESFAQRYALAHGGVDVGIIPCADGGTQLSQWLPGEVLFENALSCARLAMRTSNLKAILWHQGESDCTDEKAALYKERFTLIMDSLRGELGLPDLPIIIGELGEYLSEHERWANIREKYPLINEKLRELGESYPNCALASAKGLAANPDKLHFCANALVEFGERYYEAYEQFDKNEVTAINVSSDSARSEIELL
ncbi:MAG: sialate O-acetylesterase [Clostridia bacterium]|nr:sialate O-acetylesterase [Clostridia bacterium]